MTWYRSRSKKATSLDLLGVPLTLLADKAPDSTKFGGMKIVHVFEPAQSRTWRVMMTDNDIDLACTLVTADKKFTFAREKGNQYGKVVEWKKTK